MKIVVIVGPTASGKTDASIALARRIPSEIISADSIQVYRGLDIGSAKPSVEERRGIVHHMIDVIGIEDGSFSVARYRELAQQCIENIAAQGKLPIVVGGTGLYIHALTQPMAIPEVPGDARLRQKLAEQEAIQPGSIYQELSQVDPQSAQRLHPNDKKRLIRALEVYRVSGKPMSSFGTDFRNQEGKPPLNDALIFGISLPREELYQRINQRVDDMMQRGLLQEVDAIVARGYDESLPALQGLGYKQLIERMHSGEALEETVERIKRETRRFAKRQLTWFRRDTRIQWLEREQYASAEELALAMLSRLDEEGMIP